MKQRSHSIKNFRKVISGNNGRLRRLKLENLEQRCMLAADLYITEFLADNEDGIRDSFGERSDWIEVFNNGDMAADLGDYALTDDLLTTDKWRFPSVSLEPGESVLVFASGRDTVTVDGELHTNFNLSKEGEYLGLWNVAAQVAEHEYSPAFPEQQEDISYGVDMETNSTGSTLLTTGAAATVIVPTSASLGQTWTLPGFDDSSWDAGPTPIGYDSPNGDYASLIQTTIPAGSYGAYIRIPFTLTSASIGTLELGMRYDDGFVAYINGEQVAGANASDNPNYNSLADGIHPDSQAVVFQTFDVSTAAAALNVGENVLAIHGMNVSTTSSDFIMDARLTATTSNVSTPVTTGFMSPTTPGFVNTKVVDGFVQDVEFSVQRGFYENSFPLSLTTPTPGAFIAYTTDGSEPTVDTNSNITNGTLYSSPIVVDQTTILRARAFQQDFQSSTSRASTYIFVDDVIDQSPNGQTPPGFPVSGVNGQEMNYGIDPQIVNLYGEQAVKDSLSSLTTFSIVTDADNLWDPASGIYVNARNGGRTWERFSSVELIHPDGSDPGFQANAGLRIRGGFSRTGNNPKHAFRMFFRGEYGDAKLEYPMFGDEGTDRFDVLDLRTSQNYSWAFRGSNENTFVREVWGRDLQGEMGQPYTRSRYHHLYVNGHYWGLFQTQERVEEFYAEQYLGGDKEGL